MSDDIVAGLLQGQFEPFFQPIVGLGQRQLVGFEVLARWRHPTKGLLFPDSFIPLAETSGLIRTIDLAMLESSWKLINALLATRPSRDRLMLSVNLSTDHLLDSHIVERVAALLAGADGRIQLQLEITETLLIKNQSEAERILLALRGLGVQIALDDFGTGYSSLVYLHRLPIDCIKIDRSFSELMLQSHRSRQIVSAIVALGRALEVRTVAEGVENPEIAEALHALGCEYGQGILFGPPTAGAEIGPLLDRTLR